MIDARAYRNASKDELAMIKATAKVISQLPTMIFNYSRFVIRQCLKGKSVACDRSKDIKERLTWEAIGKVS